MVENYYLLSVVFSNVKIVKTLLHNAIFIIFNVLFKMNITVY